MIVYLHREALSSAAFVADQVLRSCSSYGEDSLDALQYMHEICMESGGLHAYYIEGIRTIHLR